MFKHLYTLLLLVIISISAFAQSITGTHEITKGDKLNEYHIKTTINGIQGVAVEEYTYLISDKHKYIRSPNNDLFSGRDERRLKFYFMNAIETTTETKIIEYSLILADGDSILNFATEMKYTDNGGTKRVKLPFLTLNPLENYVLLKWSVDDVNSMNLPVASSEQPGANNAGLYTVQILALNDFDQERFYKFCVVHNLLQEELSLKERGGMVRVTYGHAVSKSEAISIINKMKLKYDIQDAFLVPAK